MKTFFTIILILLLLRWLLKPLIKFTVFTTVNKMAEQARRQQQGPIRPEGTISVDNAPKKSNKKRNNDDGDYVDFEIVN